MNCEHGWENERGEPAPCYECLAAEAERLRAIVDRMAMTADDVRIAQMPSETVWRPFGPDWFPQQSSYFRSGMAVFRGVTSDDLSLIWRCYSTREAAEKARSL